MDTLLQEPAIAIGVTPIQVIADQEADHHPALFQLRVEALDILVAVAVILLVVADQDLQAFLPEVADQALVQAPDQDLLVLQEAVVDNKRAQAS